MAQCDWTPGESNAIQVAEAVLTDGGGHRTASPTSTHFTAQRIASPSDPGFGVSEILVNKAQTIPASALLNDMELPTDRFVAGVSIVCQAPIDPACVDSIQRRIDPVCSITVYVPRSSAADAEATLGFTPMVLTSKVSVRGRAINWLPHRSKNLNGLLRRLVDQIGRLPAQDDMGPARILARLTLKGSFVWAKGNPTVYLDGTSFGTAKGLRLPSGDGKRGGDLEMWFWLIR